MRSASPAPDRARTGVALAASRLLPPAGRPPARSDNTTSRRAAGQRACPAARCAAIACPGGGSPSSEASAPGDRAHIRRGPAGDDAPGLGSVQARPRAHRPRGPDGTGDVAGHRGRARTGDAIPDPAPPAASAPARREGRAVPVGRADRPWASCQGEIVANSAPGSDGRGPGGVRPDSTRVRPIAGARRRAARSGGAGGDAGRPAPTAPYPRAPSRASRGAVWGRVGPCGAAARRVGADLVAGLMQRTPGRARRVPLGRGYRVVCSTVSPAPIGAGAAPFGAANDTGKCSRSPSSVARTRIGPSVPAGAMPAVHGMPPPAHRHAQTRPAVIGKPIARAHRQPPSGAASGIGDGDAGNLRHCRSGVALGGPRDGDRSVWPVRLPCPGRGARRSDRNPGAVRQTSWRGRIARGWRNCRMTCAPGAGCGASTALLSARGTRRGASLAGQAFGRKDFIFGVCICGQTSRDHSTRDRVHHRTPLIPSSGAYLARCHA